MDTRQNVTADRGASAKPRYRRAERRQRAWRDFCLDELLPEDHTARLVWAYVQSLDLSELYQAIRAVEGHVGRDPIDPKILVAWWLYATIDGVGSARRLDRLCTQHVADQWLCGDVSVNDHTLSDFRAGHVEFLDGLLTQSVSTLLHQGLIELNRVAQDGMRTHGVFVLNGCSDFRRQNTNQAFRTFNHRLRVRASAGSGSFRRRPTLEACLQEAESQLAALKQESEQDASAEDRRHQAACKRAARERVEKLQQALAEVDEVAEKRERRKQGSGSQARASKTDPESRKMKMGDGALFPYRQTGRPAYNVQFATTADTLVIVGVDVTSAGGDGGLMSPMADQIEARYGTRPGEHLADGGFSTLNDIQTLESSGTRVYAPVKDEHKKREKGEDPFGRRKADSDEIAAWRQRMGTQPAKEIYKQRAATAEFPNAGCRNRGLLQFLVRGRPQAKAVSLWHALAHNFQRTLSLRAAAGLSMV